MRSALAAVGLAFLLPATAYAEAPPVGVYSCYDVRMAYGVPGCVRTSVGCYGMVITPMPVAMFGLVDGSTYADYDGEQGHFTFADGILTMTDGPRQGWRYRKIAGWSFRLIDNRSGKEVYTCPLEKTKNPTRGPW